MTSLTEIDPAALDDMSEEQLVELQDNLEALRRDHIRARFSRFARAVEVPGTPVKGDGNSDFRRQLAREKGTIPVEDDDGKITLHYADKLEPAKHHDLMMDTLQDVVEERMLTPKGEVYDGCMFFMPPGSAKSSYSSMLAPAYFLGKYSNFNIIGVSYAQQVADRFSRRTRAIVGSDSYREIMGVGVKDGSAGVQNWTLENGSEFRSAGIQGAVTSFRADCLPGYATITTPTGQISFDKVGVGDYVLSYDKDEKKPVYRRVLAKVGRTTEELWRVTTASGRVVEATGNHKIYTEQGWKECKAIAVGDVLLRSVWDGGREEKPHSSAEPESRDILQQELLDARNKSSARHVGQHLQQLWKACKQSPIMFGGVSTSSLKMREEVGQNDRIERAKVEAISQLQRVWEFLRGAVQCSAKPLLFDEMQECGAQQGHGQLKKSKLASRERSSSIPGWQWAKVPRSQKAGSQAGQVLRDLWGGEEIAWTSCGWGQHEQRDREHRDYVQHMPHEAAWCGAGEAAPDIVSMVERVRRHEAVYDIQVEGTSCFFADDILVHNCLIIDDPVAGREEADSPVIRDKTYAAYEDDLSTRLKPGGKICLVNTRWHEDDLSGRILGPTWKGQSGYWKGVDGRNWYVVNLPMICEHPDDPMDRKMGPEITDKTRLWPEWFRARDVKRWQDKGGRTWTSLYQQRPAAGEGVIILREYWKRMPTDIPPECEFIFLCYDTALEDGQADDPSAMTAWGVFEKGVKDPWSADEFKHKHLVMLGAWNERVKAVDLAGIVDLHREALKPDLVIIEKRASGHQLIQELKRRRVPVRAWLPKGPVGAKGKVPRAHAASFAFEQGVVHYMDGPMTRAVIDQCSSFPYAQNDDLVDTVTMAIDYLRRHYLVDFVSDELDAEEREELAIAQNEDRWENGGRRYYGG